MGAEGQGRSTMIDLLSRIYRPRNGNILVGNVPLHLVDMQRTVATVERNATMFEMTILENIKLGATNKNILLGSS